MKFVRYVVVVCATILMTAYSLIQVDGLEDAITFLEILSIVYLFFVFVCFVAKRFWRRK